MFEPGFGLLPSGLSLWDDLLFDEAQCLGSKFWILSQRSDAEFGDVMKESGRAAWSYARSNYESLKISDIIGSIESSNSTFFLTAAALSVFVDSCEVKFEGE